MLADDVEFELAPKQSMTDETDLAQEEDPTALDAGSPQASASVTVASDHNSDDYQRPKRQLGKKARRKARKNAQQVEVEGQLAQTSLDDKQSNPRNAEEPDQPPEAAPRLSKKDKRRAREKTKAEQAEIAPQVSVQHF